MSWDFIYRGETRRLDDAARAAADGSFIRLGRGYTHYEAGGVKGGQPVVLVGGFSVPYFIWDPTFRALAEAGLRPVRYDHFGRGYSDRPNVDYDMQLFLGQLRQLLDALGLQRVHLIGLSMGGVIAAAFAVHYPMRVGKLVLIDPAGTRAVPLNLLYKIAVLPGVSELVLGLIGTEQMVKSVASDFFDKSDVRRFQDQYRVQMQFRGFKRAILSTVRHHMLGDFHSLYARLGKADLPVMLIWGQNDRTVPFQHSRVLLDLVPRAAFHAIPDCGHIPHYELPEVVNPILLDFLGAA